MIGFFTSAFFIVPISVIAIVIAIWLIKRSTKDLFYSKIITSKLSGIGLVYDILANEYSPSCVLKNVSLINPKTASQSNIPIKPKSDIVLVGKCGVILITVIDEKGEFTNPKTGEWLHKFINQKGESETLSKINPFDATIPQIRLVSELLQDEGIYGKCVKRYVVLTQEKTRTVYNYPEVIKVKDLLGTVRSLNEKDILSGAEIRTVVDLLSDYSAFISSSK